ncbi:MULTISPECIES: hypothetical protein [Butyricimonas]|uniref:hypothetical protein n=1 Tax=Butyricimonas TaxID=574697 RepID=UPI001D0822C0|nr:MULTISPECIES: hypothetical protein [Butyricimonas]MCB6973330.1 hypothetical protein [Butyricimonas synergistica]MCG4520199.1 hypothetical protein [Butyricimonas sp. DFI.6.44]
MKKNWYVLIFFLIIGCYGGNEEFLNEEKEIEELQGSISRSINLWSDSCDICSAFNKTYGQYREIMDEGYKVYKEKKGCCKDCFNLDFNKYVEFHNNSYGDRINAQIKAIEYTGKMTCPQCEVFMDVRNSITSALYSWLRNIEWSVGCALEVAGIRKCKNWQETPKDSTGGGGGAHDFKLPDIVGTYKYTLNRSTQKLLEEIGGDVETTWLMNEFDEYLLRICYAFQQSDDPISANRVKHLGGQIDSEGRFYLVAFKTLYDYLSEAYFEPELLTISELQAKGRDYRAIVIEKSVVTSSYDDNIFGDLWGYLGFVSDRTTSLTEFYCWRF